MSQAVSPKTMRHSWPLKQKVRANLEHLQYMYQHDLTVLERVARDDGLPIEVTRENLRNEFKNHVVEMVRGLVLPQHRCDSFAAYSRKIPDLPQAWPTGDRFGHPLLVDAKSCLRDTAHLAGVFLPQECENSDTYLSDKLPSRWSWIVCDHGSCLENVNLLSFLESLPEREKVLTLYEGLFLAKVCPDLLADAPFLLMDQWGGHQAWHLGRSFSGPYELALTRVPIDEPLNQVRVPVQF